MVWLQENWIVAVVGLVVAVVLLWWLFGRAKRADSTAPIAPAKPAKPLEPAKPDIIAAEPARFKPTTPKPAPPPVAPSTAAPVAKPIAATQAPAPMPKPEPKPKATPKAATETKPKAAPKAKAAPVAAAKIDNLQLLKGVGPKLVTLLGSLGVTRFAQIAGWSDADIAAIDPQLGTFQGRITRDNWVDQAGYLARGDKAGFEAKYGALGGEL